ncbi:hypothetical protein [Gemmiger sp.]
MNRISDLTRRLWAALLALCLVLTLTLPVFAEGESETEEKETYHIGTVDELLQLADYCRLDSWSENRTVVLDADLELTGSGFTGIPSFSGVFQGQGHVISGLSLVDDGSVIGFFRYVQEGANIRDLVVRGRAMPSGSRTTVGGIAGSNAGTLHNCRFEGVSSGASIVGGIVGTNLATGVIESCTTTGSVYGAHFIGGLAGENHGVIANSTNTASVNTTVEQNDIDLSELTLNDLIGTENAADITDIGGIAGQSGGVIRACMNRGTVGYQHMGYNVGGIAGSQTGYIEGCVNYGTVYARKEGGGIVGQMEPSSTLQYTKDTLQELSDEMSTLQTLVNRACDDASAAGSDLSNQLTNLQNSVTNSRNAIENLLKEAENGVSVGTQYVKTDLTKFKQNIKDADIPDINNGNNDNNGATSDVVKDYDETTPPSDTDNVDPDYTLKPNEEFGRDDNTDENSTDSQVADSTAEAPAESTPAEDAPAVQSEDAAPVEEAAGESTDDRAAHGQPDPADSAVDDGSADGAIVNGDDGIATKPDERYPIDPGYTVITDEDGNDILDNIPSSKDVLNGISDALPDSVDVEIPKVELTNRDAITASKNDLSSNLTGIGDIVSSLNTNANNNTQALINDVKAISAQINKIGQTLSGASDNVKDADDLVDDISDDDTDDDVEAKVTNCINSGEVNADINAGGITGAMARENDLDPEDDYTTAGSESLNFTFKTRVVARDCTNYGTVSAKKQNAGGIVGDAEMGSVIDCKGFGTVDSEDATAVGGVAGVSKSTIRESYAKCRLSGAKQVGGIAGSGSTIENCRAMVMIDNGSEQIGAIAGIVDDPLDGSLTGNTFVDEGVAGVDSVSYKGIAEPLSYEDFTAQENLPDDFSSICVRFVTDEDALVQQYYIPYGSDFPTDQLPPVPNHQGQYGNWEDVDLTNMTFDATIHAEYSDMNTVRQSQEKRNGRPVVLVEGSFDTTDELMLHETDDAPETIGTLVESWGLELPADAGHTLRYMPPETTDNTVLWVKTDAGWQQAETKVDGSYLTCTAPAGTTAFAAVQVPASKVPLIAAACGAGAALLLVILFIVHKKKKKKKTAAKK